MGFNTDLSHASLPDLLYHRHPSRAPHGRGSACRPKDGRRGPGQRTSVKAILSGWELTPARNGAASSMRASLGEWFKGEPFSPDDRGRGANWARWNKP